jgi:hypothetical protein
MSFLCCVYPVICILGWLLSRLNLLFNLRE